MLNVECSPVLPKNIFLHRGYYRVRVQRRGVKLESTAATLERAIEIRDRFLSIAGGVARSNTGLPGISDSVHWSHNHPHPGFHVSHGRRGRRRFCYGSNGVTRLQALRAAVAHRARLTGERFTAQQIQEALNHV
jgi:hypothetical protein